MSKRQKLDPMSVLVSFRAKRAMPAPRPTLLPSIPPEEMSAFQGIRHIIEQSKLLPYLDKRELTSTGERVICISEDLVNQLFPGTDPLTGNLPAIDAFIYVYDGIIGHESHRARTKGDLRQFLGEVGFRQMLLELDKACRIHEFCCANVRRNGINIEPITKKNVIDARRDAFSIHARAKEVFQQIAMKIKHEMDAADFETPPVYHDAYQFACDMRLALEPLARIGKQIRVSNIA